MNEENYESLREIAQVDRDISNEGSYGEEASFYAAVVETGEFEMLDKHSPDFSRELAEEVETIRERRLDGGPNDPHSKIVETMKSDILTADEVGLYAHKLIDEFTDFPDRESRTGRTYSAAAIYVSARETGNRKTKRDTAKASGVTEASISKGVEELKSRIEASEKDGLEDFKEKLG